MKSIKQKIAERAKRMRDLQKRFQDADNSIEGYIRSFLEDMDSKWQSCRDESEAMALINMMSDRLYAHIKQKDPYVDVRLVWNECEDWRDMRCERLFIRWSMSYAVAHKVEQERCYDLMDFLLDNSN